MILARPTVEEERWLLLADRYPALRAAARELGSGGRWKTTTWLGRVLGFLLGLFAVSMLGGVLWPLPSPLIVGGVLLMIVAEWLVAQRRVHRSGVEEVVYLCGMLGIVVQLLIWSNGHNAALGAVFISTAVLLVGWRLLNPLYTTLAMAGYSLAIGLVDEDLFSGGLNLRTAAIFCAALALIALSAGARQWRRPAHDRMCDGLVIVMPWLCYAWLLDYGWRGGRANYLALAVALGFCAECLFTGVKRRAHAPLVSAMGSLACAAYSLHLLLPWPLHWQLITAGGVLLVVAIVIERSLRERSDGITASKVDAATGLDIMQIAGAAHLAPAPGPAPPEPVQGQGGDFGGGGASGRF